MVRSPSVGNDDRRSPVWPRKNDAMARREILHSSRGGGSENPHPSTHPNHSGTSIQPALRNPKSVLLLFLKAFASKESCCYCSSLKAFSHKNLTVIAHF
jgi:hypothetical protein